MIRGRQALPMVGIVLALCWLGPRLDRGPDELVAAQAVADDARAAPAEAQQLALAERAAHPSAGQPARKRHASTREGGQQ